MYIISHIFMREILFVLFSKMKGSGSICSFDHISQHWILRLQPSLSHTTSKKRYYMHVCYSMHAYSMYNYNTYSNHTSIAYQNKCGMRACKLISYTNLFLVIFQSQDHECTANYNLQKKQMSCIQADYRFYHYTFFSS